MRHSARALAWGVDAAREKAVQLVFDLRWIKAPDDAKALVDELHQTTGVANEFVESTTRARQYAIILGWSRSIGKSPAFDRAVAGALETALDRSNRAALRVDHDLTYVHDQAIELSQSAPAANGANFLKFAQEVDRARRIFRTVNIDIDQETAQRLLTALIVGLDQHLSGDSAYTPPGQLAQRLIAASLALLPAQYRERYDGEFRSEMSELTPREQRAYALQVIWRCWQLRSAVLDKPTNQK